MKSKKATAKQAALMAQWKRDPLKFFKDVWGLDLLGGWWAKDGQRAYQAEIVTAIVENAEVYVVSGNGVGKDFLLGRIVPWWVCTRKGIAITTAPKQEQVDKILWGEIRSAHASAKVELGGDLKPAAPYWKFGPKWYATGVVGKDENAFQGFHGAEVLAVSDEAAGIPEFVWPAIQGCAVGENDRQVNIGNPTCGPTHPFAKGAMSDPIPGKQITIRVKGTETPNCVQGREVIPGLQTAKGVERLRRKFGRNGAIAKARIEAQFPVSGSDSIIGFEHIGPARERWAAGVRARPDDTGHAGCDVARFGDDLSALASIKGPEGRCTADDTAGGLSQDQLEEWLALRCKALGARSVAIDGGAMGAGPIDYLRKNWPGWGISSPFTVHEVQFGANAYEEEEYADKRTELWWNLREWLKESGSMEIDEDLEEELTAPTYSYVKRKIRMEPKKDTKKRLGRSPDRADALALAVSGRVGTPIRMPNPESRKRHRGPLAGYGTSSSKRLYGG